jgi:hypothetical protein
MRKFRRNGVSAEILKETEFFSESLASIYQSTRSEDPEQHQHHYNVLLSTDMKIILPVILYGCRT